MDFAHDSRDFNVFCIKDQREIPPRPDNQHQYPEDDLRHWYDCEYAGFLTPKNNIPRPDPGMNARSKSVVCIYPGNHPYMDDFKEGLKKVARFYSIKTSFITTSWDMRIQTKAVDEAIGKHPDLIIMIPENTNVCEDHYRRINESEIPVICCNSLPEPSVYRHILAWTGPDDWGQQRLLAREFAELMGYRGSYVIVRHIPGSSAFNARTWGFAAELKRIAPEIKLLEAETSYLDPKLTEQLVSSWIATYGRELTGIVNSGCAPLQMAINNVAMAYGRKDIIRVCMGSSERALHMVKSGSIHAAAYQSGEMDGALAMQTAADWFNGFKIETVRYLPSLIVNRDNVQDFIEKKDIIPSLNDDDLYRALSRLDSDGVDSYFEKLFSILHNVRFIKEEFLRGFIIQIFSILVQVLKENGVQMYEFFNDYEGVYKYLFDQRSIEQSLLWIRSTAKDIIAVIHSRKNSQDTLSRVLRFIDEHFDQPLSLKTLADQFDITPGYLGQQIKTVKDLSFCDYINSVRVDKARELLEQTNMKAKEIAFAVGYSDHNYFYRVFKKYCGLSTTEFREEHIPAS